MTNLFLSLLFSLLISVGAWISLPIGPVPFSLQTLFVFLAGFLLPMNIGVFSIILYIIMGVIGLPVFAGGRSGIEVLTGPTSGFIFGFLIAVIFISHYSQSIKMNIKTFPRKVLYLKTAVLCVGATIVVQMLGVLWGKIYTGSSWESMYSGWVYPFYFNMVFKAILAVLITVEIWIILDKRKNA